MKESSEVDIFFFQLFTMVLEADAIEYHDEIHEQLHKEARVDYTKPIFRNGENLEMGGGGIS